MTMKISISKTTATICDLEGMGSTMSAIEK